MSEEDINRYGVYSNKFEAMQKIQTIKAVQVNKALYKKLRDIIGLEEIDGKLILPVSWSDEGMKFGVGDYIAKEGYTINKEEMNKTYEKASENKEETNYKGP